MKVHDHLREDVFLSRSTLIVETEADELGIDAPSNVCVTDTPAAFSKISQSGKNVLVYFWSPSADLKARVFQTEFSDLATFSTEIHKNDLRALPVKAPDLLAGQVLSEMGPAIEAFSKLVPGSILKISFCKTVDRPCPLFHVDRISLRLLCTLRGPGTEWLSDEMANRKQLGRGSNRKVVKPGAIVYEAKPFQICILKGESHFKNMGAGAVHRSPAVPDPKNGRWFVRIDGL